MWLPNLVREFSSLPLYLTDIAYTTVVINTYSHHAFQLKSLLEIDNVKTESQLINILGAAGDVAIAAAMVYLLHRSRTGFKHSDGVINRLVRPF